MRFNSVIYFVTEEMKPNSYSDDGESVLKKRKTYANEYSMSLIDRERASTETFRASGRYELRRSEYFEEPFLETNGRLYRIGDAQIRGDYVVITYGEEIGR